MGNALEELGSFFNDDELETKDLTEEDTAVLDEMDAAEKANPELKAWALSLIHI